jgi:homoserine O-acetyltransferase
MTLSPPVEQTARARHRLGPHEMVPPASRFVDLPDDFPMHRGGTLRAGRVAYETLGQPSAGGENVILVLPGLSADAHIASHAEDPTPGWWQDMVGVGKPIDTARWHVICVNSLGSCRGSTGPASRCPCSGDVYGLSFPDLSLEDVAAAAAHVLRSLGFDRIACVVGVSMGGMAALALIEQHPGIARAHVNISSALQAAPFATAIRSLQREVIRNDPEWADGGYTGSRLPIHGMQAARKLGVISYRSAEEWRDRFGRRRIPEAGGGFSAEFEVEDYLQSNADRFVACFDPNSYLYLSRAIDWFELEQATGHAAGEWPHDVLVMGVRSDQLFPVEQQADVAQRFTACGSSVQLATVDSNKGHDAFLVDSASFGPVISTFLSRVLDT